jgi:hypothetical protein
VKSHQKKLATPWPPDPSSTHSERSVTAIARISNNPVQDAEKPGHERETNEHAMPHEHFPPQKLPDPWLIDSEYLLAQLAKIRELALQVPLTNDSYQPTNTVVDAIWRLEKQLRFLLHLHRDGQRQFAAKADQKMSARHQAEKDALKRNEAARKQFRQSPAFLTCVDGKRTRGRNSSDI